MRRITSVFSSRRSDKSDVQSVAVSESSQTHKINPTHPGSRLLVSTAPPTPQLTPSDNPNSASSASSTASNGLATPIDDTVVSRPTAKKNWMSWLPKKSLSIKRQPPTSVPQPEWDPERDPWQAPTPVSRFHLPQSPIPPLEEDDTDDDTPSESEDESEAPPASSLLIVTPTTIAQARAHIRVFTLNALAPPVPSRPLLNLPRSPLFPRSSTYARYLSTRPTMHSTLHRQLLLRRLDHQHLTRFEELSILPFASRPKPKPLDYPLGQTEQADERAVVPHLDLIRTFSQGLKTWMWRSCFEERMLVWTPDETTGLVKCRGVTGTGFGVAALEYSEPLEFLSGFDFEPTSSEPVQQAKSASSPSSSSSSSSTPDPSAARPLSYKPLPSPLRLEYDPPVLQITPEPSSSTVKNPVAMLPPDSGLAGHPAVPESSQQKTEADQLQSQTLANGKRGVRFAEEVKDDQIPLSYVLRIKKSREEKAKFLRDQRERRLFEEERLKQEEERRKRETERREWELERNKWEQEKKMIEEERRQRLYAEEVTAARARRESQRAGPLHSSSSSSLKDPDRLHVHEATRYTRPAYDKNERRHTSDSTGSSPRTASPGSSRPPSIVGSPGAGGSNRSSAAVSRPPSVYSSHTLSSSEDVRLRESRGAGSRRASMVSDSSHLRRPSSDRSTTFPSLYSPNIPVVPPMPYFAMDMPLLPPAPPFMMQQYGYRPPSRTYNSATPTSPPSPSQHKPRGLPASQSLDRVNHVSRKQQQQQHRQSSPAAVPSPRPGVQGNHRLSSRDANVSARSYSDPQDRDRRPSGHNTTGLSSRGRASMPQVHIQPPNHWASPPAVSVPPSASRPLTNRRQSVIT